MDGKGEVGRDSMDFTSQVYSGSIGVSAEYVLIALGLNVALCATLHVLGKATIYFDYGDVAITLVGPIAFLVIYFGLNEDFPLISRWGSGAVLVVYLVVTGYYSIAANKNIIIALMTFVAKLTVVIVYYLVMIFALAFWIEKLSSPTKGLQKRNGALSGPIFAVATLVLSIWIPLVTRHRRYADLLEKSRDPHIGENK